MLHFEWLPVFLLLPLPLFAYFFFPRAKKEESALRTPFFQRAQHASGGHAPALIAGSGLLKKLILVTIWCLLVSAAARPTWVGDPVQLPSSGRDLMLAVDLSKSMETPDMVVSGRQIARILVVKHVVGDFIERRKSDRVGLILFGTNAYLQAPLTYDKPTVKKMLEESVLGIAGPNTAIGDSIGLAIKRLQDRPAESRVVILLTDGANTAGEVSPRQAAELAKQAGLKIYTIGVGADQMRVSNGFFGDSMVNPSADLDEATLNYMAEITGGQYFRARDPQDLQKIYEAIDQLEPIEQDAEVYRPLSALFFWPLGAALVLSLVLAFFSYLNGISRLSPSPRASTQNARS